MQEPANVPRNRNKRAPLAQQHGPTGPNSETWQIARRAGMDLAEQPESLPVLEAFQEFLDQERRRARKTLFSVSLFFLLLMLGIIGAGGGFAYIFMQRVENNVGSMKSNLSELDEAWRQDRQGIESSVAKALADTSKLEQNFEKEQDTLKQLENALNARSEGTDSQMKKLVQALLALNKKNKSLQNALADVRRKIDISSTTEKSAGQAGSIGARPTRQPKCVEVPIALNGSLQIMKWRIPIPE